MARASGFGLSGVLLALIAGLVSGVGGDSGDPQLWQPVYHAVGAAAFLFLLAGGIALGRGRGPS